jgi:hypothetical protein
LLEALDGLTVAVNAKVLPTFKEALVLSNVTPVTDTVVGVSGVVVASSA